MRPLRWLSIQTALPMDHSLVIHVPRCPSGLRTPMSETGNLIVGHVHCLLVSKYRRPRQAPRRDSKGAPQPRYNRLPREVLCDLGQCAGDMVPPANSLLSVPWLQNRNPHGRQPATDQLRLSPCCRAIPA